MMLSSPQSPPAAAALSSFSLVWSSTEPPPHAVSASKELAATTARRPRRFVRCRTVFLPFLRRVAVRDPSPGCSLSVLARESPSGRPLPEHSEAVRPGACAGPGAVCCRPGHPVDEDAEKHDREAGRDTLAGVLLVREAVDDVVAERLGADQAADDDHGQHVEQPLV